MSQLFENIKRKNNFLFIIFYTVSCLIMILFPESLLMMVTFLIFLHLGATIYGVISKNPVKSYLFGFLIHPVIEIFDSIYSYIVYSTPFFAVLLPQLPIMLFYSVLWGIPGFFAAQLSSDKSKSVIYILIIVIFILLQFVLTVKTW